MIITLLIRLAITVTTIITTTVMAIIKWMSVPCSRFVCVTGTQAGDMTCRLRREPDAFR